MVNQEQEVLELVDNQRVKTEPLHNPLFLLDLFMSPCWAEKTLFCY